MNILVTGANGQLGNEIRIIAKQSTDNFIFTDVVEQEDVETHKLDITNLADVRQMVAEKKVDIIINCAAYTNVDAAEAPENYNLCHRLNALAPQNLATAIKEAGGLLVHISTDYVFGAEPYNTPCNERQEGTPTGIYGKTKLIGEQNIINTMKTAAFTCCHPALNKPTSPQGSYIIIRTAWLYSEFGKNFCKTMLNLTASKPELKVVFDQCGTPTYALDVAKAIATIVEDYKAVLPTGGVNGELYPKSGIYNFSNEGVCSWFDFTKMIAEYSGQTSCDIQPCYSSEYPSPVKRPAYSVLDKSKIKQTFGIKIPYWTESLKLCITNLKK